MNIVTLRFQKIFPASEFIRNHVNDKTGKQRFQPSDKLPDCSDRPGVYIWGFHINGRFIPYYTGKSQSSIANRINQHIFHLLKPDSTYARLSKEYMEGENPFFTDPHFWVQTSNWAKNKLPKWFREKREHFKDKVLYINNLGYFEEILGVKVVPKYPKRPEYPISNIPGLEDYITDNIENILVTFADCSFDGCPDLNQNYFYEVLEAHVKFSLRGKTVSKSMSIERMELLQGNKLNVVIDPNGLDLFKDQPSVDFPGYHSHNM